MQSNETTQPVDAETPATDFNSVSESVFGTVSNIWNDTVAHLPFILAALLLLFVTWVVANLVQKMVFKLLGRSRLRDSLRELMSRFAMIGVWIFGILAAAIVVFPGLTPASAIGSLGVASVAIGFAFKDIFENFFAGVLLMWKYPFETGDFIEAGDVQGQVKEITIRMTTIRRVDDTLEVVPNGYLLKNPVRVLTAKPKRRVDIMTGVGYSEDVTESIRVIEESVKGLATIAADKPVQVMPTAFGASSIDIQVVWWTDTSPLDVRTSIGEVITAIKKGLDDAGIEIPFPYRTLTFRDDSPIRIDGGENSSSESDDSESRSG